MALPSTWKQRGDGTPRLTGIGVRLVPGDPNFECEIQRTSDDGAGVAASTGAELIWTLDAGTLPELGGTYFDFLPMDDAKRFYRARHTGAGYDAGAYTGWTTGHKPVHLPDVRNRPMSGPSGYPLKRELKMTDDNYATKAANTQGTEFSTDMYLPSTYVLNVGTTGTPSSLTKTLRVSAAEVVPNANTSLWAFAAGTYVTPGTTPDGSAFLNFPLMFPPGVTITNITASLYRPATSASAAVVVYRADDNESAPALATLTHTASTWQSVTSAVSQLVTSTQRYSGRVDLTNATTASAGDNTITKFAYFEATYTMPSYDKAY